MEGRSLMKGLSVTVPLHTPLTLAQAAAIAQQSEAESRIARRIGLQGSRRQSAHQPTGPGGAGILPGARTQQHRRDAGRLRRQRQSPARCQIEQARLAPGLDQHRPQRRTARGLRAGPQHVLRIARPHQKDARRVETELGQPRRVQTPGLGIENILPDPEDRPHLRRPDRQPHGETRRRSEVRRSRRVNLMQRRARDASAQRLIKSRRA